MIEFFNGLHICAKFHENQKGSRLFFVDLAWNNPKVSVHLMILDEAVGEIAFCPLNMNASG